mmetsp:Transcript_19362/g.39145  ORF Transcript_19362/g.39145 Transcript_19362/m.39145 type:complete len:205 (-) Transcript_19362:106-720(-)
MLQVQQANISCSVCKSLENPVRRMEQQVVRVGSISLLPMFRGAATFDVAVDPSSCFLFPAFLGSLPPLRHRSTRTCSLITFVPRDVRLLFNLSRLGISSSTLDHGFVTSTSLASSSSSTGEYVLAQYHIFPVVTLVQPTILSFRSCWRLKMLRRSSLVRDNWSSLRLATVGGKDPSPRESGLSATNALQQDKSSSDMLFATENT